ncbi:MAG: FAD-binding protein [Deltaproteobacteria bacterium]|nr:FAD-binding protein [Deltaproteobacteria bacterium]
MSNLTPLVVEDVEGTRWDDGADLVVVGLGAAGITAAIEARERGADVVLLDRFEGGGATAISGGVFYAGGGTHIQQAAGVNDTVENMYRYLSMEVQDAVTDETLREFCETSAANVKWLTDRGVPFLPTLCPVKTSYPTNEYHLYYSGNETFPPYSDHAKPAQRGHRADGGAFPGFNIIEPLRQTAIREGVRILLQSRVSRLIVDGSGGVAGLEYQHIPSKFWRTLHQRLHRLETTVAKVATGLAGWLRRRCDAIENKHSAPRRIRCKQGVVLCAGGFIFNREMVAEHLPEFVPGLPLGTAGDDGLGIRLGQSVGGKLKHMQRASAWRFLYPPNAFAEGVLINDKGKRFANEFWYGAKIGEAMVEQNHGVATLIIDKHLKKLAHEQSKPGKLQWFQRAGALMNLYFNCKKAKDVDTLAKMLDVPRDALQETIDEYNAAAQGKRTDRFDKAGDSMRPLPDGPYYAIDCSLGSKRHLCAVMTLGGLAVDEQTGQVLNENGTTVPGLYAAGRNAVGICSRQYVSGLSIADCIYSGLRASRHAIP